jgi:RNA methyltransferase, TrmH family
MFISSLQNPRIKNIVKLANRRQRDAQQATLVEGAREVSRALRCGIVPREAYLCPALLDGEETAEIVATLQTLSQAGRTHLFEVSPAVFGKIAYRGESGGALLVVPYLARSLADLPLGDVPFLAVIEDVEKPGNLGAILRTADAAGVDGLIAATHQGGGTDLHNPNVVRASLGTLFAVPVATARTAELIPWLRAQGLRIVTATPTGERPYTAVDLTGPVALVAGSEAHGLSRPWVEAADEQVVIPMRGIADSLNLAIATALLLYEVVRQRAAGSA